ncbi:hypothetical protein PA6761_04009 [Pseudomonas aeruginosa]
MVTEHIFDFEWRPLQNYLRDRDIAIPPFAAEQESRSDALYNWIVSKGYSGKEGLNLGTYYHISDYGVIGLALLCAENVGDILKVIRAYVKLFNRDIANVGVKPRENYEVEIHISVNFKPEWNDASRQFHVNVIASATYKLIMDLLGNDFPISALTVPVHGADKTIYEGFFSLPVKHEGNDIIFSFPAHQLNRTLATANPAVFQSALTMAGESFNALLEVEMGGLRQRIELFLDSIPDQYPSLVTTAKYLRMNERTVRRRLADEGCTYRQIVDKARKERAIALLLNSSIPVDRISDILGTRKQRVLDMHSDVGPGSLLQNSETVSTDLSSLRLGKEHLMNFNNRNNQILSMIAETQFDAYVLGYIAKARTISIADDSLRIEAEGSAMLAGLISDSCRKRRTQKNPFPYLLLQIAHEALDRIRLNLANIRNISQR